MGVYEPQQIASAAQSACKKSDAILIPLDNQLVAAMPSVIKATKTSPALLLPVMNRLFIKAQALLLELIMKKVGVRRGS